MERKHYVRINPGLQLVEKAGLLAKIRERGHPAYLLPEEVLCRTVGITSASPVPFLLLPVTTAIISVLL